jgi:hypothetical protein
MNTTKFEKSRSNKNVGKKQLEYEIKELNFRDIQETELNAQEMSEKDFNRLVENIRVDGCLTSTPLVNETEEGKYICISGHHRIRAAIKAGLNFSNCIILKNIDESTRIRLQLSHNDIHGESNKDIVAILLNKLNAIDIHLVETKDIEAAKQKTKNIDINVPTFKYINICLIEQSRKDLVDMIMSLEKSDSVNWLISKEEYENVKDLLTYAFEHNFKTPGQAFGKFLDIIKENKELIKRWQK